MSPEPAHSSEVPPSLRITLRLIASDYRRICASMDGAKSVTRRLFWMLSPNVVALALFRVSHYLHTHGLRFLAWPVYLLNLYLTKADIPPSSFIGESCFLGHVSGTVICGTLGRNVTMFAAPGIGGGMGDRIEGRPAFGLPVIGDDVVIGARAMVLGAIYIGDGAIVGAGVLVTRDLAPGATAVNRPPMILKGTADANDAPA